VSTSPAPAGLELVCLVLVAIGKRRACGWDINAGASMGWVS
jgi:hypothetical protein